jgi:selenocysteine lyase/cysteine desulfurase
VDWTNPWGGYKFVDDIELREDGGTPGFLQAIRTALCIELKEQMGMGFIKKREEELVEQAFDEFSKMPDIKVLADNIRNRLGVFSFYHKDIHYNLFVKLLNDRFGIQTRGGCACAGTYGHYLLQVSYDHSKKITDRINRGDFSTKPGWVRLSLHPTMKNSELSYVMDAIRETAKNASKWSRDYHYNRRINEFVHKKEADKFDKMVSKWFEFK